MQSDTAPAPSASKSASSDAVKTTTRRGRVPVARLLALRSRPRFAVAVIAGSVLILLIGVELAIMAGLTRTSAWVSQTGADLFVTPRDTQPFEHAGHFLEPRELAAVEGVPGVTAAVPIFVETAVLLPTDDDDTVRAIVGAWEPGTLELDLASGRVPERDGEMVVDDGLAREYGLELGDTMRLRGRNGAIEETTLSGTTKGTSLLIFQYVVTTPSTVAALTSGGVGDRRAQDAGDALRRLADELRRVEARLNELVASIPFFSLPIDIEAFAIDVERAADAAEEGADSVELLVDADATTVPSQIALEVAPDVSRESVAARVRAAADVEVYTVDEYRAGLESGSIGPILPVFAVVIGVAVLVGALVLGMTLSTMVAEGVRDYAVLRALGTSQGRLNAIVLRQGFVVIGSATVVGMLFGLAGLTIVRLAFPLLPVAYTWGVVVGILVCAFLMLIIGALAPMRRVRRVDPLVVFRS